MGTTLPFKLIPEKLCILVMSWPELQSGKAGKVFKLY
jgi:hypothetical protein